MEAAGAGVAERMAVVQEAEEVGNVGAQEAAVGNAAVREAVRAVPAARDLGKAAGVGSVADLLPVEGATARPAEVQAAKGLALSQGRVWAELEAPTAAHAPVLVRARLAPVAEIAAPVRFPARAQAAQALVQEASGHQIAASVHFQVREPDGLVQAQGA